MDADTPVAQILHQMCGLPRVADDGRPGVCADRFVQPRFYVFESDLVVPGALPGFLSVDDNRLVFKVADGRDRPVMLQPDVQTDNVFDARVGVVVGRPT